MPESTLQRYIQVDLTEDQMEFIQELLHPHLYFRFPMAVALNMKLVAGTPIIK